MCCGKARRKAPLENESRSITFPFDDDYLDSIHIFTFSISSSCDFAAVEEKKQITTVTQFFTSFFHSNSTSIALKA